VALILGLEVADAVVGKSAGVAVDVIAADGVVPRGRGQPMQVVVAVLLHHAAAGGVAGDEGLVLGLFDVADPVVAVVDVLQHAAAVARLAELAVEGLRYAILKERFRGWDQRSWKATMGDFLAAFIFPRM
jgi:hypothetical protein